MVMSAQSARRWRLVSGPVGIARSEICLVAAQLLDDEDERRTPCYRMWQISTVEYSCIAHQSRRATTCEIYIASSQ